MKSFHIELLNKTLHSKPHSFCCLFWSVRRLHEGHGIWWSV